MIHPFNPARDGYGSGNPVTVLIGPPGCGKTSSVLNSWLIPSLADLGSNDVLACSFTKDAAGEMRDRLSKATNQDEFYLRRACSTIHSESFRLVRLASSGVSVWDASKAKPRKKVIQAIAEKTDPEAPPEELEDGWEHYAKPCSELRAEAERIWGIARHKWPDDIPPLEHAKLARYVSRCLAFTESRFESSEISAEIRAFEAEKKAVNSIDFTDMLVMALDCDPPWRELLLVDECQDLSNLQIKLIEHWAESSRALAWIGDPDQGIYRFSGADGAHLTGLMGRSDELCVRSLQKSYRVPAAAHRLARAVILRNRMRIDAPYHPADKPGEVFDAEEHRVPEIAESEAQSGTVFVLCRTCARIGEYAKDFEEAGIPFANERGSSPMKQTTLVNLVVGLHDIISGRLVGKDQLRAVVNAIPGRPRNSFLLGTKKAAQTAVKALEDGQHLRPGDIGSVGLDRAEIASCGGLTAALEHIGKIESTLPQLRIVDRAGVQALRREPAITLTTMHASKGREARTVIVDLEAPWPVRKMVRSGDAEEIEAERRVLYVALTRTMHCLVLVRGLDDLADLLGVRL